MNGNKINSTIAITGSNSVHTIRYLHNIAPYFTTIILITNKLIENLPYNIIQYDINFKFRNILASNKIANILKKYNISIIQIHQANSYAFHTIRAIRQSNIKCKIILTTWGSDILVLPKKNFLTKKIVEFNLKNSDIITSDSLYMSYKIKELVPTVKNLYSINFGIDVTHSIVELEQKQNIIFSNRLHKDLYQIDKIIIAFANLIKNPNYNNYKLIIAGDGINNKYLKDLTIKLGLSINNVEFVGFLQTHELYYWYKIAKIFISIPLSDATSISLLEAMSFGCYPILSNIPANLEFIINNINGKINENSTLLANDIMSVIDLLGNNNFNYNKIIEQNYNIIKQLANTTTNLQLFLKLLIN